MGEKVQIIIIYDENYPDDLETAKSIKKSLKSYARIQIIGDGCIVGREIYPNGEHFENDDYMLIIVGNEPFGSGLMAPSIIAYVTDDLLSEERFFPEKTAVVTRRSMVRLNNLFDSPKFKIFEEGKLDEVIEFFGLEKATARAG